ncbi:MAG TPA: GNAT family N-acetyltransferase [Longimicrobiales bacterium]|nr:GNAT family N-acetyltransferase [Longimicrobiales bacterium]
MGNGAVEGEGSVEVVNNERKSRFEAEVEGKVAVADYRRAGDRIEFTHTEVPEALRGKGVGEALAREGLEHARREALDVVPTCRFIAEYIDRHPEYQDLVAER